MKKPIIKTLIPALIAVFGLGAGIAFAQVATTTGTTTNTTGTTTSTTGTTTSTNGNATSTHATSTIQIMMHLCKDNIRSASDLRALESGKDPVSAFIATEINCPVTALPGHEAATGTIASLRMPFDFTVMTDGGTSSHRLASSTYMQHKVSETDMQRDLNGDGAIATSTSLDTSHYEFMHVMAMASSTATATSTGNSFRVLVTETSLPNGFSFGALRFTPTELTANNDRDTLVATDTANARIELDMSRDQNRMVMLHVYNFPTATSTTGTSTATSSGSVVSGTTTTTVTVTGGTGTSTGGGSSGGGTGGSTGGNTNTGGGSVTPPAGTPKSIIENLNSVQRRVQNVFDRINNLIGQ